MTFNVVEDFHGEIRFADLVLMNTSNGSYAGDASYKHTRHHNRLNQLGMGDVASVPSDNVINDIITQSSDEHTLVMKGSSEIPRVSYSWLPRRVKKLLHAPKFNVSLTHKRTTSSEDVDGNACRWKSDLSQEQNCVKEETDTNGDGENNDARMNIGPSLQHNYVNEEHVVLTSPINQASTSIKLTDDDILFLKMGRDVDFSTIPVISMKERSAIKTLTTNLADIERSLESVRELPSTLKDKGPQVSAYFFFFTNAFERTYVAAQAVGTGAVEVAPFQPDAVELLGGMSWIAEKSNLPFIGFISIFSAVATYQRKTKITNSFRAFGEFFCGKSRDHHLLVSRKLAEQICLLLDPYSLDKTDSNMTGNLKVQVKKIVEPIRKHLRKVHLDILENLCPVEERAMSDLASITEEVLRLYQHEQPTYEKLRASNELEKASHFLNHVINLPSFPCKESLHCGSSQTDSLKSPAPVSQASNTDDAYADLEHLIQKIHSIEEHNRELQKHADANAKLSQKLQQMEAQVRTLSETAKSEKDLTVSSGCQAQAQINPNMPKAEAKRLEQRLEQIEKGLFQVQTQQETVQLEQEKQSREIGKVKFEQFVHNRVLTPHEACEFIRNLISFVYDSDGNHIDVSCDGKFVLNGERYYIGKVRKGGKTKTLWKDQVNIKFEDEYQGVKSVLFWFERMKLRHLYDGYAKKTIYNMFIEELHEPSLSDMTQPFQYQNHGDTRDELFEI